MSYGAIADKHGNLYVTDISNSVVRKVNLTTGIATIVAGTGNFGSSGDGGAATAASLNGPSTLAFDSSGNYYIATSGYIRKVNIKTGIITTVAGNGIYGYSGDGGAATAAEFSGIYGLCADRKNNLYLADLDNSRIRKVDMTTGKISTFAGNGTGGYNGDSKAATAAEINYPFGVCADSIGNIYIGDQGNFRIRKVDTNGIITTFAGDGVPAYSGDGGQATDAELYSPLTPQVDNTGNLYVTDANNNDVRVINIKTGIINTAAGEGTAGHTGDGGPATAAELNRPFTVSIDSANNFYITDGSEPISEDCRWVRKVDAVTHIITNIAGNGNADFGGDGVQATTTQLVQPHDVKIDALGNLYITDFYNDRIRLVNNSGVISTFAGNGLPGYTSNPLADSAGFYGPDFLLLDKAGNVYVTDYFDNMIREINVHDSISTFAGTGYGAPYSGGYGGIGGPAQFAELYFPAGMLEDGVGNIFFSDSYNQVVREITNTGIINTIAGNGTAGSSGDGLPATAAELNYPAGIGIDNVGNLYIADQENSRIREVFAKNDSISTFAGTGIAGFAGDGGPAKSAKLFYPANVTVDPYGVVYIADTYNNRIRTVNPYTHIIKTIAGNGTLGFSGDGGPALSAKLNTPVGICFDVAGNMYIADEANNRVRKVTNVVSAVNNVTAVTTKASLYPNPNNGSFMISLTGNAVKATLSIYNVLGEQVYHADIKTGRSQINMDNHTAGVYLYRVIDEQGNLISDGKLVVE
jgi:sugar lactone lactonase YvrE